MSDVIHLIGAALRADADALRSTAQNIANSETVAYQREIPVSHTSFEAAMDDSLAAQPASSQAVVSTAFDSRAGTLKSTGEPLHVAIEGPGYFVVSTANGETLTRRGDFTLNADGDIVSADGNTVLGQGGPIRVPSGAVRIDHDGTVAVNNEPVGRLRIEEIGRDSLRPLGDGRFVVADGAAASPSSSSIVRQGFVETSNVSPVGEMVQMMETLRHFEALQRFARGQDDILDKALTTLGRV